MTSSAHTLREAGAIAVLAALVALVVVSALVAATAVGGTVAPFAGVVAGAGAGQLLRRPAGRTMGRLLRP